MRVCGPLFACFFVLLWIGCSSDSDTPLGSEFLDDGLIKSHPGELVQDTLRVASGDASFVVRAVMFTPETMELGRKNGAESWPVFRVDFSTAGLDTTREVESASLRLSVTEGADTLRAVFIELGEPLSKSDTLKTITLADTIPDGTLTNVDRLMMSFPRTYTLPPDLVESWIRGKEPHNGIAVALTDTTTTKRLSFGASEYIDTGERPLLNVFFAGGVESTYKMAVDGTFVQDLGATSNLVLSDGVGRRVLIPIDLTVFHPRTLLHEARLMLHTVPGSFVGQDFTMSLYAPKSTDIDDPDVLTGTPVSSVVFEKDTEVLSFSVRNILSVFLAEGKEENALVLRYAAEGTFIRRVEFYPSTAADSLKPSITYTYSVAPEFPK